MDSAGRPKTSRGVANPSPEQFTSYVVPSPYQDSGSYTLRLDNNNNNNRQRGQGSRNIERAIIIAIIMWLMRARVIATAMMRIMNELPCSIRAKFEKPSLQLHPQPHQMRTSPILIKFEVMASITSWSWDCPQHHSHLRARPVRRQPRLHRRRQRVLPRVVWRWPWAVGCLGLDFMCKPVTVIILFWKPSLASFLVEPVSL